MNDVSDLLKAYQALNVQEVIDYNKFNQYAIVHHSATIEGSTLTANEIRVLLEDGITPKGKPLLHSLMIKDHFNALQFTLEMAAQKTPITIDLIQSINAQVMKTTGKIYHTVLGNVDASTSMFRKGNVSAGGSYFVNYDNVLPYTEALVKKLQAALPDLTTEYEKLQLSFSAHFDLVSIHPFYDGNGRTSRLLMNFIQQYFSLPLAIVFLEDKADYFTALQQTRKQAQMDIFYDFMFGQYAKFLSAEIQLYNQSFSPGSSKGFSLFF